MTEAIATATQEALCARAEARQLMRSRQESTRRVEWKPLKAACAHVQDVIGAGVNCHFNQFITELERIIETEDERGFY